jgi:hypothetical protein
MAGLPQLVSLPKNLSRFSGIFWKVGNAFPEMLPMDI